MPKKPASQTQKTRKGHEIPVPTRKDFLKDLKKASKSKPEGSSDSPEE